MTRFLLGLAAGALLMDAAWRRLLTIEDDRPSAEAIEDIVCERDMWEAWGTHAMQALRELRVELRDLDGFTWADAAAIVDRALCIAEPIEDQWPPSRR